MVLSCPRDLMLVAVTVLETLNFSWTQRRLNLAISLSSVLDLIFVVAVCLVSTREIISRITPLTVLNPR